jgi:hypothetical protein
MMAAMVVLIIALLLSDDPAVRSLNQEVPGVVRP